VIRYTERDFAPELREWTRGRGADVVYDSVGRTTFEGSLASLRPRACSRCSASRRERCRRSISAGSTRWARCS